MNGDGPWDAIPTQGMESHPHLARARTCKPDRPFDAVRLSAADFHPLPAGGAGSCREAWRASLELTLGAG